MNIEWTGIVELAPVSLLFDQYNDPCITVYRCKTLLIYTYEELLKCMLLAKTIYI